MTIFLAPDAEGEDTVWADVPGHPTRPVALITERDLHAVAIPLDPSDKAYAAAKQGAAELWEIITDALLESQRLPGEPRIGRVL